MPSNLDQFYTKNSVAKKCIAKIKPVLRKLLNVPLSNVHFVEPSAGDGSFYKLLPKHNRYGIDIMPKCRGVIEDDFLKCGYQPPLESSRVVVIGNPPFGKRGKVALEFINKSFTIADTVAFILPVIFRKFTVQKHIKEGARLVHVMPIKRDSFRTDKNDSYIVNTEMQVWTTLDGLYDMRLYSSPPISHPDFVMHQYNNTKDALKVFKHDFDFAVPCQGWQDYSRRETNANSCERNKQWILFKSNSKEVLGRLYTIDFDALAMKCSTAVPGFRKGDVVTEYTAKYVT